MFCLLTHQAVPEVAGPDEQDVLDQVRAVGQALEALGHRVEPLPCDLDLGRIRAELERRKPDLVFNLVESLGGLGCLVHVVPGLLEALHLPFTGAGSEANFLTANKRVAKRELAALGLPTPALHPDGDRGGRYIVKSIWEHASQGMDAASVVSWEEVPGACSDRARRFGGEFLAEQYVEGREFNVALLDGPEGTEVLPIAEIAFEGFREGEPRIVDYAAKWDVDSEIHARTPRRIPPEPVDSPLLLRLAALARSAFEGFGVAGYGRVDFRVDEGGDPWILEVNTNPCLSPDAGFAAALERAGISFEGAVRRIVDRALSGCSAG